MSLFDNAVFNSSLYEALYLQIEDTLGFAKDFFQSCVSSLPIENLPKTFVNFSELSFYEEIAEVFYFNEFQFLLFKTFSLILLFTLLLIFVSWRVYGKRISERFMKPATSATIEQLKENKIKNFFKKKKIDAKFKLAGPGHKLSESTISNQSSNHSRKDVQAVTRSGLSEESKVAAEAALARLQQTRDNPTFNTSLAAIKAQVKKELENETACNSKSVAEPREPSYKVETESEVPKNFAASGVYFKCPLISNDILARDEWKKNIKTFLYEQLEDERGLTACLIIQSCNNNREKTLIDALRTADPIQLELDRNLQVLLPSQAANKVQLPPSFYALSPEELKREQQLRAEVIEKSQMLRTKAMREKDEIREMRKYKFAIIRIRFPDGILLQGTFSIYERYQDIHEFVQENLEHSGLPFVLNTPTGHKLIEEEDANKTLIDLRLVPATVLTFAWHNSIIEDINKSPNRDVYLKPEVMVLVQEI
ncbi:jg12449 [Pararge aegeria aegeria]|uniref:Jg12449 protein n=1 Tax=Pararge aegeria aegeria TaxID=348720 RepID=A0A8S4RRZ6_9NEOP|nr:jg12449 [Pararge aegeria aegeria]